MSDPKNLGSPASSTQNRPSTGNVRAQNRGTANYVTSPTKQPTSSKQKQQQPQQHSDKPKPQRIHRRSVLVNLEKPTFDKNDTNGSFKLTWSMSLFLTFIVVLPLMEVSFSLGRQLSQTPYVLNFVEHLTSDATKQQKEETHNTLTKLNNEGFEITTFRITISTDSGDGDDDQDDEETGVAFSPITNDALPAGIGQQMRVSVKNVNIDLLRNKLTVIQTAKQLLEGMFIIDNEDEVDRSGDPEDRDPSTEPTIIDLKLTSRCHDREIEHEDSGISCLVLFERLGEFSQQGQVILHTSPSQAALLVDLFLLDNEKETERDSDDGASDDDDNEDSDKVTMMHRVPDLLSLITRVFQTYENTSSDKELELKWNHYYRGFNPVWEGNNDLSAPLSRSKDLGKEYTKTDVSLKKIVGTVETRFQQIAVYDMIDSKVQTFQGYQHSLLEEGTSYESYHSQLFQPDRHVFLDGVMQSTRKGDEPYHEALVQPAMFAHPNPKRAAIIGGGEGATLREILKHDTIEHVKMIDIDEGMMEASRKFLPGWNSCANIEGSTSNCFDEPRADVLAQDALAWFIDRFGPNASIEGEEPFDVIIMDALDPQDNVAFASALYSNDAFTKSLFNGLSSDGVLVMQLGEAPYINDGPDEMGISHMRASLERDLLRVGFHSFHKYEEPTCGFDDPWSFLVSFKSLDTRRYWFDNEAEIQRKIQKRLRRPRVASSCSSNVEEQGEQLSLLKNFDGATMSKYQVPSKAFETITCRSHMASSTTRQLCQSYTPAVMNKDESTITFSSSIYIPPSTWNQINKPYPSISFKESQIASSRASPLKTSVPVIGQTNAFMGRFPSSTITTIPDLTNGNKKRPAGQASSWQTSPAFFNAVVARRLPHLLPFNTAVAAEKTTAQKVCGDNITSKNNVTDEMMDACVSSLGLDHN